LEPEWLRRADAIQLRVCHESVGLLKLLCEKDFTHFECDQICYASRESVRYSDSDAGNRMTLTTLPMVFSRSYADHRQRGRRRATRTTSVAKA
jgi:hypothetical protein